MGQVVPLVRCVLKAFGYPSLNENRRAPRSGILEMSSKSVNVCGIPTSFTIWLAGNTRPSRSYPITSHRITFQSAFSRNFDYQSVHVTGAELIAQICAESPSVSRLVHVSHLNAAVDSPSAFYRTKALGEQKVKKAFPNATIVRPGPMFGHEDKLLNSMASESPQKSSLVLRTT